LRIVNRAPLDWVWPDIANWRDMLRASLTVKTALAVIGGGALLIRARRDEGAKLVAWWMAATLGLLAYGYVARGVSAAALPPLIPQFHFYFYARAAGDVLTGYAVWIAAAAIAASVTRRAGANVFAPVVAAALVGIVALAYAHAAFPSFRHRPGFERNRLEARALAIEEADSRVRDRLRDETPASAVVLASADDSLHYVGAAGRGVICVPAPFSNPYVPFTQRAIAQVRLLGALLAHDRAGFAVLARAHGVTHVLLSPGELLAFDNGGGMPGVVRELSRRGGFAIYAVETR
jgi:hypothetical protein